MICDNCKVGEFIGGECNTCGHEKIEFMTSKQIFLMFMLGFFLCLGLLARYARKQIENTPAAESQLATPFNQGWCLPLNGPLTKGPCPTPAPKPLILSGGDVKFSQADSKPLVSINEEDGVVTVYIKNFTK
jgi:hypothetical protein